MGARFLTRDPLEVVSRDPYGYAFNDPVNVTDPTGMLPGFGDIVGGIGDFLTGGDCGDGFLGAAGDLLGGIGELAWEYKYDIALTLLVPGAGWTYRAYRLTRLAEAGIASARATRATGWLAGRMWVGRGGVKTLLPNGSKMYSTGQGAAQLAWRGPAWKHGYGWSSNLTKSVRGRHDYFNFHINHGRWL